MVLTKTDFVTIAKEIKTINETFPPEMRYDRLVNQLCEVFKRSNGRFDEEKFLNACGF